MRAADREERVRNAQGDSDGLDDVRALAAPAAEPGRPGRQRAGLEC